MKRIDKHFISEIDQKLKEFDQTHPASPSQQAERDKYRRIYTLRDTPTDATTEENNLWR